MNRGWGIIALVVAALYWLQAVLIPMALAVLLTFLLSPVVGSSGAGWVGCRRFS